jgi:PAS domain S-box-containing protein
MPDQPHPIAASLLTEIIGISSDAIICVDHRQHVTFFNEGAEQIFGYTAGEVLGESLDLLLPDRHRSVHAQHIQQFEASPVNARRMGERRQISGRRKNGEEFPAEAAIAKLETETDVVFSVVLRDVTEKRRLEAEQRKLNDELQRAVRAREDTVAVVSHDLRNPVTAVRMLSRALLNRGSERALPTDAAEQLDVILQAAEQMDALIQDLLDFARSEAGTFTVDVQRVPCAPLLGGALRTMVPIAAVKQVQLVRDWTEPLPDVYVDPERIAQVISNVVGNAISFSPARGRVLISAAVEGDEVVVTVKDDGPGIPTEHLELIFDRFWQSNRRNRGAGLGLPIAKAILAAHGGRIWAESSAGAGATFRFTLSTRDRGVS